MEIPSGFRAAAWWRNDGKADLGLTCEVDGCSWYLEWNADGPNGAGASLSDLVNEATVHKAWHHDDTPMTSSLSP